MRITVSDHGAGIPAADLPHIFEPFYRGADAIERQIHGNGLGLSLVRRIVVAHGGQVTVDDARRRRQLVHDYAARGAPDARERGCERDARRAHSRTFTRTRRHARVSASSSGFCSGYADSSQTGS